jgi:DNA repair exonuclease SbcCD ATPase subunit
VAELRVHELENYELRESNRMTSSYLDHLNALLVGKQGSCCPALSMTHELIDYLCADRDERLRALEREREDHGRQLSVKADKLREKERELQTKVAALEKKESELVEAKEALRGWEVWRRDLSAHIKSVCDKLGVGEEESAAGRLALIP